MSPFARFAVAHATSVMGDASVTVSLAGSIFFTIPSGEARPRVLLFLALTMAPFAIVAPFVGPMLDRARGGRRLAVFVAAAGRALLVLLMINNLDNLALYPIVFGVLVLGKVHTVAKAALTPELVENQAELVEANSRLALVSAMGGAVGGGPAAALYQLAGPSWSLSLAFIAYGGCVAAALRLPRTKSQGPLTELEREELLLPSVRFAATAMSVIRAGVGFISFLFAFSLKRAGEPAWFYGLVIAFSLVGNFAGAIVAPPLRKKVREEIILGSSALIPAVIVLLCSRSIGRPTVIIAGLSVALGTQTGKLAFDSLVQRDAPDAARGRAFARFETHFQLAWVIGALIPVATLMSLQLGLLLLAVVLGTAGLWYLGGLRTGRDRQVPEGLSRARRRLDALRRRRSKPPPAGT